MGKGKSINQIGDTINLVTFRCSACNKSFQLIILNQLGMECPHCHYQYVKVRGEWQSKKWVDYMLQKQRERLGE
jgi:DNA-directed RNA polymerase subunit RPC12/RpoP